MLADILSKPGPQYEGDWTGDDIKFLLCFIGIIGFVVISIWAYKR